MKFKSKILLAACSLLVLSGATAATSTFAWYTANRQVTAALNTVGVQAQLTNLSVAFDDSKSDTDVTKKATADTGDTFTLQTSTNLTDASGNGLGTFIKPMWKSKLVGDIQDNVVGYYTSQDDYHTKSGTTDNWSHKFAMTFTAAGSEEVALFLSPKSTVTNSTTNTGSMNAANSVRYSLIVDSAATDIYCNPNGTGELSYWTKPGTGTTPVINTVSLSTAADGDNSASQILDNTWFTASAVNYTAAGLTKATYANQNGFIKTLTPTTGHPATCSVVFYVWVEGTDAQTVTDDTDFSAAFNMMFQFYSIKTSLMA
jgi:hypothetical protein